VSILSCHTIILLELKDTYRPTLSSFNKAETYENVVGTMMSQRNLAFLKPSSLSGVCMNLITICSYFCKRTREILGYKLEDLDTDLFIQTASIASSL